MEKAVTEYLSKLNIPISKRFCAQRIVSQRVHGAYSDTEAEQYSQAHYGWIKQAGITKTPTAFMNG